MSQRSTGEAVCGCGGELGLVRDRSLPQGVAFPVRPRPIDTPMAMAVVARDHPGQFAQAMLRQCNSCQAIYAWASEAQTFRRRNGSTARVEAGAMYPVGAEALAAIRERWREQAGIDEPVLPDTSDAYNRDPEQADAYRDARTALIRAMNRQRLTQRQVADRRMDLADRFPEKAATLVAEAAWHADRAGGPPTEPASGFATMGEAIAAALSAPQLVPGAVEHVTQAHAPTPTERPLHRPPTQSEGDPYVNPF